MEPVRLARRQRLQLPTAASSSCSGFVDDDAAKVGRHINGVPVFGRTAVADTVERLGVSDILLALPSASRQRRHQIIEGLRSLPVHIRTLPGMADLASGRVVDFGLSRTGPRGSARSRSGPAQLGAAGARPCGQGGACDRCGRQYRFRALLARFSRSTRPSCCSSSTANSGSTQFTRSLKRRAREAVRSARPCGSAGTGALARQRA